MMKRFLIIFCCISCFSTACAQAMNLKFNGFVADEANVISPQVENDINMTLWDLQKKTKADVAVVTLNSLEGKTIEQYAIEIGRFYKLGDKIKNNGVVFLTVPNDRKMRIELGTGLEKTISLGTLEQMRDIDILPYYKQSEYEKGIQRGAYQIANAVAQVENVQVSQYGAAPPPLQKSEDSNIPKIPMWGWPLLFLGAILGPSRRRRRFSASSFGGFGGGGGFGGSGCSGSW